MPQPFDYENAIDPPLPSSNPRKEIVCFVAFVSLLNIGLLLAAAADVYYNSHSFLHGLWAAMVAFLASPIANGVFLVRGLILASELRVTYGYPKWWSVPFAVLVPSIGIIANMVAVTVVFRS